MNSWPSVLASVGVVFVGAPRERMDAKEAEREHRQRCGLLLSNKASMQARHTFVLVAISGASGIGVEIA